MKDIDSLLLAPPLTIAVLYQDSVTRDWATELCERARRQCALGEVQWACWKLDLLSEPGLFEEASTSARRANLIVVAAYTRTELPKDLKRLMEESLKESQLHRGALVALLGKRTIASDPSPARDYLNALAETTQVDYFLREFTLRTEVSDFTFESIAARANTTTPVLSEMLRRSERAHSTVTVWERSRSL